MGVFIYPYYTFLYVGGDYVKKRIVPYMFILPAMVLLIIFKIYPIFIAIIGSLFDSGFGGSKAFVGIANYVRLFKDGVFWQSLKVTLLFNIFVNPIQIALALFMALLVNEQVKGINIFRSVYYVPVAISMTVAAVIWGIMLNPNSGIVNSFLGIFGISPQPFLTSQRQALPSIIAITSWKGVPYWMMFLLAGLQGIPKSIYEAAKIDGCNKLNTIFKITIPLLKRSLAFVVISDTITNLLLFSPMYILTNGGPNMSTNVLMYEAYKSAFSYMDMGRAYSMITILLLLIFIVVGMQTRLLKADY